MNNSASESLSRSSLLLQHKSDLTWIKATFGLYILTMVLGFFGNLTVIIIIGRKKIRLWRPHEMFILNLAICDLLLVTIYLPFQIYIFLARFRPSVFYCKFIASLITAALGTSIFTLTVMAVHRCHVITKPFRYGTVSQRSVLVWLALVWLLSIGLVVPKILVSTAYANRCIQQWPKSSFKKIYTIGLFTARFVIPLVIISYAYFRIAKDLARSPAPRFDFDENGQIKTRTARRENIKVVKTLTVIVVLFVICMLPLRLTTIVMLFGDEGQVLTAREIRRYASILTIFHSCVNPIAYGTFTKVFRSWLSRYACWFNSMIQCRPLQYKKNREEDGNIFKRTKLSTEQVHNLIKFNRVLSGNGEDDAMKVPAETTENPLFHVYSKTRNRVRKETAV